MRKNGWNDAHVEGFWNTVKPHEPDVFLNRNLLMKLHRQCCWLRSLHWDCQKMVHFSEVGGKPSRQKTSSLNKEPCEHSCYGKPLPGQPDVSVFVHERLPRLLVETCLNSTVSFWLKVHSHKGKIARENHGKSTFCSFCRCVSWKRWISSRDSHVIVSPRPSVFFVLRKWHGWTRPATCSL